MGIRVEMFRNDASRTFLRSRLVIALAIAPASAWTTGQIPQPLTTVRQIRALAPDQARQARPVRLRGVVTAPSGWKNSFFVQDATAGISVDLTNPSTAVQSGQTVEIRGVTGPGLFAPVVIAQTVTALGNGTLPSAPLLGSDQLAGGKQDSQRLAIRGIVRSAAVLPRWGRSVLVLEIDIGGGNLITARVIDFTRTGIERLPASTVYVTGVCGTAFNDKRQFIGIRLFVANMSDVKVERPAPADPFDVPLTPLDSLLQFGDLEGAIQRIRVRGVVTYSRSGQGLYLQDGPEGIFVRSVQKTPAAVGSRLEAVGYPAAGRFSPELDDAVFRVIGAAQSPVATTQTASNMIVERDGFPTAPYDSVLVRLTGRLVEQIPGPDQDLLIFKDGASIFTAKLPRPGQALPALDNGSLISVTGICAANADDAHEARSFELLLRSPADLAVLEAAPWWTASHARWVVGILCLLLLVMAAWMVVARHAHLHALAITDPLTGLYNRRGFMLLAEQQWKLFQRVKAPFVLFYIDLDKFKEINDTFGHKEGDLLLQSVAALLRDCFRKSDIIGRMGGDEFAVAAVDTDPSSLGGLQRRLAEAVGQSNDKTTKPYQVVLSAGVLACDNTMQALSLEDLLARADALLYEQKRQRKTQGG
jgi:diguanylate cyclase (GGDEF)-like protein